MVVARLVVLLVLLASGASSQLSRPGGLLGDDGGLPARWQGRFAPTPNLVVNLANGNVTTRFVTSGFAEKTLAPHLDLLLAHNAAMVDAAGDPSGGLALGPGWSSTVGSRVALRAPGRAEWTRDDGAVIGFTEQPDGSWLADAGSFATLEAAGGGWIVRDERRWEHQHDGSGALVAVVSELGNALDIDRVAGRPERVTDPSGRHADLGYDASGRLATIIDVYGNAWTLGYDVAGRLASITDPLAGRVTILYDASDRIRQYTDYGGQTWQLAYWTAGSRKGRVKAFTAPDGRTMSFDYVTEPGSTRTVITDARGGVWWAVHDRQRSPALLSSRDPLGHEWTYAHDVQRLLTKLTSPSGRTWSLTHDGGGRVLSVTDRLGRGPTFTYDALGNRTTIEEDGFVTSLFYADPDHPTRVSRLEEAAATGDPAPVTTLEYFGPADGVPAGSWNGLLASLTDPAGVQTRFAYDAIGQLLAEEEGPVGAPGGLEVRWDDGVRFPLHVEDAGMAHAPGTPVLPALPAGLQGRLEQHGVETKTWWGALASRTVSVTAPIDTGGGFESSTVTRTYQYDHWGRVTSAVVETDEPLEHVAQSSVASIVRGFTLAYDDLGRDAPITVTAPDGVVVTLLRDLAGRVDRVESSDAGAGALGFDVTYQADGDVETILRDDGTSSHYAYTVNGLLESVEHRDGGALVLRIDLVYDGRNLPCLVTETTPGDTVVKSYGYDARKQLVTEVRSSTVRPTEERTFSYDLAGNRSGHELRVGGALVEQASYRYDNADPLVHQSANNRLVRVELADGAGAPVATSWLLYDNPFGHVSAVVRQPAGSTSLSATRFVYTALGQPWLAWDETWNTAVGGPEGVVRGEVLEVRPEGAATRCWRLRAGGDLVPLPGAEWVTPWATFAASFGVDPLDGSTTPAGLVIVGGDRLTPSGPAYDGTDHLWSVRTTSAGGAVTQQDLTAFGETSAPGSAYGFAGGFGVRQGFAGAPLTEQGLVRTGHRWYAPRTGRFAMRDPRGLRGGFNVYAFALNQPTSLVDPAGLAAHGAVYRRPGEAAPPGGTQEDDAPTGGGADDGEPPYVEPVSPVPLPCVPCFLDEEDNFIGPRVPPDWVDPTPPVPPGISPYDPNFIGPPAPPLGPYVIPEA